MLLFAAILTYVVSTSGDVQSWWTKSQTKNQVQANELETLIREGEDRRKALVTELEQAGQAAQTATVSQLNKEIKKVDDDLARLTDAQPGRLDRMLAKTTFDMTAIREEQERLLQVAFLERKRSGLLQALKAAQDYEAALAVQTKTNSKVAAQTRKLVADRDKKKKLWEAAKAACTSAEQKLKNFDNDWLSRNLDRIPFLNQRVVLEQNRKKKCDDEKTAHSEYESAQELANRRTAASEIVQRTGAWVKNELPDVLEASKNKLAEEQYQASNTISAKARWAWQHYEGNKLLRCALIALILITLSPYIIRLFLWFVLAPIAMRRPSIRLQMPEETGSSIPPAAPSTTSVAVRLQSDEELLVRQDYLQTSSIGGPKDTQWFLDWKKPITSFATGLRFLTRIRGDDETITISATKDGLAEVTILELPDDTACVLQPHAIAAVVQPIGRPLRITPHWRFTSLNAWLTLQFRYLVFYGPARIILKGGRGVRIEAAERGRIFGQDQLVGFSADLAYSVTRTETFWPYFLGREQLLKDRVTAGSGVLIVEEAPFTARNGEVPRGLEGIIDAGMKAFGM